MSIEIKGVIIGEGKPKVCVPIVESHDEAILNKLKNLMNQKQICIELRIDFYENIHQEDALRNLFLNIAALQIQKPVILTIRTAAEGGEVEIDPKDYSMFINQQLKQMHLIFTMLNQRQEQIWQLN